MKSTCNSYRRALLRAHYSVTSPLCFNISFVKSRNTPSPHLKTLQSHTHQSCPATVTVATARVATVNNNSNTSRAATVAKITNSRPDMGSSNKVVTEAATINQINTATNINKHIKVTTLLPHHHTVATTSNPVMAPLNKVAFSMVNSLQTSKSSERIEIKVNCASANRIPQRAARIIRQPAIWSPARRTTRLLSRRAMGSGCAPLGRSDQPLWLQS